MKPKILGTRASEAGSFVTGEIIRVDGGQII
jgi:hypothetical protein